MRHSNALHQRLSRRYLASSEAGAFGGTVNVPLTSISYTVQPGDYLYKIGLMSNVPWQNIAAEFHISYPYLIFPGEVLLIPGTGTSLPWGLVYNPKNREVYAADDSIFVLSILKAASLKEVLLQSGHPSTVGAYDSSNGYVYLAEGYLGNCGLNCPSILVLNGDQMITRLFFDKLHAYWVRPNWDSL
jgi:LysM repeat protein